MESNTKNVKKYSEAVQLKRGMALLIAVETGYKVSTIRAMLAGFRTRPKEVQDRVEYYQKKLVTTK